MALVNGSSQQLSFDAALKIEAYTDANRLIHCWETIKEKKMCSFDYVGMTESILST